MVLVAILAKILAAIYLVSTSLFSLPFIANLVRTSLSGVATYSIIYSYWAS